MNKKQSVVPTPSAGLTAAALQDHISRQLSLSLRDPLSPVHRKRRFRNISHSQRQRGRSNCSRRAGEETAKPTAREEKTERVLDPHPPALSLAQRMGLVERPQGLLSTREWLQVKTASRERQDSSLPCPVCQEEFGMKEQVLLSCSHVFHRQCLSSVEKFSGKKSCPLCRTSDYQTRVIFDGEIHHQASAAVRIQAWWRAERVRRWYKNYRERVPPFDPTLRAKYYQRKLESLTSQMVDSCTRSSSTAVSVLADADSALATARATMRILDSTLTAIDWSSLQCKAIQWLSTAECPICISPILPQAPPSSSAHSNPRPVSLLSCGHLLHYTCVSSLERYCTGEASLPLCPLCRAPYHRRPLDL